MESRAPKSANWWLWAAVGGVIICLCVVVTILAAVAIYLYTSEFPLSLDVPQAGVSPEPLHALNRPPSAPVSKETADTIRAVVVPDIDPYDLACRLQSICDVEKTLPAPEKPLAVGDRRKFWVQNQDTTEHFQVELTLRHITAHSYFWVQDGVQADQANLQALMTAFEEHIYPTNRRFFGSEWTPGVDNDPHINVLYVGNIGQSTAGYYSVFDEYNPLVRKYSNAAEAFVFNADASRLDNEYTYGTLAHEFQHMIHWYGDSNESSWINEGSAELAAFLNGYTVGGSDHAYVRKPDIPLDDWTSPSEDLEEASRHYGQAFLFMAYFLDRFGEEATQALVRHQENGLTSVDLVLQELGISDPLTGKPISVEDVSLDWLVTMYLGDGGVGDGRFAFHNYADAPRATPTQTIRTCPQSPIKASVSQFGPDYINITCEGSHTLEFTGSTAVAVLPAHAHSGKYAFWSNRGDLSDMTLTREFDFTPVTGPIELSFWTWYDIEEGWDYLYLETSVDGESWKIVETPSCTELDLSGNSHGCGVTGRSGGGRDAVWIRQSVDLSEYAGRKVHLRFEYVTDAAINGDGLLLDDLSIPAINYSDDFESGGGDWRAEGFARIHNILPQTFRLALIRTTGQETTVEYIPIRDDQTASIPLSLDRGDSAVLLVTGTQRFTHLPAGYTIEIK